LKVEFILPINTANAIVLRATQDKHPHMLDSVNYWVSQISESYLRKTILSSATAIVENHGSYSTKGQWLHRHYGVEVKCET